MASETLDRESRDPSEILDKIAPQGRERRQIMAAAYEIFSLMDDFTSRDEETGGTDNF